MRFYLISYVINYSATQKAYSHIGIQLNKLSYKVITENLAKHVKENYKCNSFGILNIVELDGE